MVEYESADVDALAGVDYSSNNGTLTFVPGGPLTQTIQFALLDDQIKEPDETFNVVLANEMNAQISNSEGRATATIIDNEDTPRVSVAGGSISEDGGTMEFVVSLTVAAAAVVTVDYETADGSARAPDDYEAESGTVTFAPGDPLTQTIDVTILDDSLSEGAETFRIELRGCAD